MTSSDARIKLISSNGAFTTANCQLLLRCLIWASSPSSSSQPIRILALMGGSYFSNGIALNTIEASPNPGQETWANINAIDDIVEFLLGDTASERSEFMRGQTTLTERGIVTIACLRGNAAAGGVAMAAACDVVFGARGVVLNPAYRAMGLHGSEFHSYSYARRCGALTAAHLLRDMTPMSTTEAREKGLIDVEIGAYDSTPSSIDSAILEHVRALLLSSPGIITPGSLSTPLRAAPWAHLSHSHDSALPTLRSIAQCKLSTYSSPTRSLPPLVHYRTEELSQMLLDSFHPIRSQRYHSRRQAFIRKYKSTGTPARYARELAMSRVDEEDLPAFDDAPGWVRGEEWNWVGISAPESLKTSEGTRVDLYPELKWGEGRKGSVDSTASDASGGSGLTSGSSAYSTSTDVDVTGTATTMPITPSKSVCIGAPIKPVASTPGLAKMGMQGFELLPIDKELLGPHGDVQFQCLYQAEA